MKNTFWYRNPSTGLIETKEFAADSQLSLLRISDPVLTTLAQGYTNADMIGDILFPSVRTEKETGRFPAFGKEAFIIPGNIKRAVGGKVAKMQTQTGYITTSLSEYALGFSIENRERQEFAGNPDQLLTMRQMQVNEKIALYRENLQATLATTSGNYASGFSASGAAYAWGGANTGDAVADMRNARLVVAKANGRMPDTAWFTPTAWELFINNNAVLNRIKYGGEPGDPAQMSTEAAAALLQCKRVVVGYAVYGTGSDGGVKKSAPTMNFLWESVNGACAGWVITGLGWGVPSFGYTYDRMNSPVVESYYDNSTKSMVYDYEHFFDPAITLNTAGYLIYALA